MNDGDEIEIKRLLLEIRDAQRAHYRLQRIAIITFASVAISVGLGLMLWSFGAQAAFLSGLAIAVLLMFAYSVFS